MVEFVECGGWSVSFDATGKATVSMTVVTDSSTLAGSYNIFNEGGVSFQGNVMSVRGNPMIGSGGWFTWNIGWQGIGN